MFSLALAMLGNGSDADDVVQDAFVVAASRWETLENPGGYLRVSVVNGAAKEDADEKIPKETRMAVASDPQKVIGSATAVLTHHDPETERDH